MITGRTTSICGALALSLGVASGYSYSYQFDDGMVCSNGVYGVESSNGLVCCDAGCGTCGGVGCSKFGAPDLGAYDCCVTEILDFGEPCTETKTAPCFIDDHWPEPMVAAPIPETADNPDETPVPGVTCSNGLVGVESTNGAACCDAACGFCGGSGCSRAGGPGLGANDCCSTEIVFFGEACSESKTAPCFIDGPVVIVPTVAPTVSAPVDPVDDMSYSYTFEYLPEDSFEFPDSTFEYPEDDDGMMCSNGVAGIESSNGLACCAPGCGQCGGAGCSQAGGSNLGADDCCTTEILDFGWACSVTGTAPCVIDGDVVAPAPTPMMPAPTPETVEEIVTDTYSYDYEDSTFDYPEDDDGMMCSNGVAGLEDRDGLVCCAPGCGKCYCSGAVWGRVGGLGPEDCCTTDILESGWACSVTGTAPCVIDGDVVAPAPTPMMPAPTPETVEEIVTDTYSYSYDYELSYMW